MLYLIKFRVYWRDLNGKKHRQTIRAVDSYQAAVLCSLEHDDLDVVTLVKEVKPCTHLL